MVNGAMQWAGAAATILLTAVTAPPAAAAALLPNGDFEAGSLIGWVASERRDGVSDVVTAGGCFSPEDTTRLSLFGNHAAILRSGPSGRRSSVGILTSDPFIAGDGVVFAALTGTRDGRRVVDPVHFEMRVLTADGETLTTQRFNTSVVRLHEGCPGTPRDGRFFVHYFDTRKFLEQEVRIQFRQNTNTGGIQPFTLVDQVIRFGRGEGPLFTSKPEAVAALSETTRGVLRLDASGSFDPDEGPLALTYSWQIDGENQVRVGEYPCIGDLADGTYEATLFVNDGFHAVSDSLVFEVTGSRATGSAAANGNGNGDDDGDGDDGAGDDDEGNGNGDGDDPVPTVEIGGCDEEVVATDASVDSGSPDGGDGDDGNGEGDGNGDDDGANGGDEPAEDNAAPTVDLDADDSTVSGNNFATTFQAGDSPVPIADDDTQVSDGDGDLIVSATIISQAPDPEDAFSVDAGAVPAGITFEVDADSVRFTGTATANDYELALRAVRFDSTDTDPGSRTITVEVSDGVNPSTPAFASISITPP